MIAPATTSSVFRQVRGLDVLTWPVLDAFGTDGSLGTDRAFGTDSAFGTASSFGADIMVTTRRGGVSSGAYAALNLSLNVGDAPADVLENRCRAAAALGADPADFVFCEQVHGSVTQVVGAADRGRGARTSADAVPGADALATADPGTVLAVLAADCVPVVLYDPHRHVLACAHAGWRGTVARAAASAVAAMESLGSRPTDVVAGVGPAIAPDRYQVGPDVAEAATTAFGDQAASVLRPTGAGQWQFDLWTANRIVLQDAGVPDRQIHVAGVPTGPISPTSPTSPTNPISPAAAGAAGSPAAAGPDDGPDDGPAGGWFFSHRAEQPCGRFAVIARLRPQAPPREPGRKGIQ